MSDGMGVPQSPNTPGGQPQQPFGAPQQMPGQPPVQGAPPFPQQPQPWQQQTQYPYPGPPPAQQQFEPDWQQLADQREAQVRRKRLMTGLGIGIGVVVLGAGAAAIAVLSQDDKPSNDPVASQSGSAPVSPTNSAKPSGSGSPTTKQLPPAITAEALFADQSLNIGGHNYVRKSTTTDNPCWKATGAGLGDVLTNAGCVQLMRGTYFTGNTAVTVGVAVFKSEADAAKVGAGMKGQIQPLFGKDNVGEFCRDVACSLTNRVEGRYVVFTVAGPISGGAGAQDPVAQSSSKELDSYFDQLLTKGS
ncbi:hypothetical protein [Kitasatospora sp. NPDC048407]|uniref:hypothetical protein n=1 Tax=Kitasatospora sp. NPDC048407 TaxID=3364051 RepID=UPI0037117B96